MPKQKPVRKAKTRSATRRVRPLAASTKRIETKTRRSKPPGRRQIDVAALMKKLERQESIVRELADRQAIMDCAVRFSRGVNRLDKDLLLSVFHPDAVDDHGFFVGNREDFLNWIDSVYTGLDATQHFVTNQTVELDGDTAHAETYWLVANVAKNSVSVTLRGGRYIDRFERRNGAWAIAARVCLIEWNGTTGDVHVPPDVLAMLAKSGASTKNRDDPSYQRPLRITRATQLKNPHVS